MAHLLWGKVYFQETFAGYLKQEPGERFNFTYDPSYLNTSLPAIAHTLPKREAPHYSEYHLFPFFDNLIAEGWLKQAQARLLGNRQASRFALLLAFGTDCAGAVSVIDPEPVPIATQNVDLSDPKQVALLKSRASLSGIQPKLTLRQEGNQLRPSQMGEVSTHIGKLPSQTIPDLVENEYLTTLACKQLLPNDNFVELNIHSVAPLGNQILVIKRFDRTNDGRKVHFEEFTSLLNKLSIHKYDGSYKNMATFLYENERSTKTEVFRLFCRICMGILMGNTDMHLKNFAMLYTPSGLRLTPNYDLVSAAIYPNSQEMALRISKAANLPIKSLKRKNIMALAKEFSLTDSDVLNVVTELEKNLHKAKEAIFKAPHGTTILKEKMIHQLEKRWNGIFRSS